MGSGDLPHHALQAHGSLGICIGRNLQSIRPCLRSSYWIGSGGVDGDCPLLPAWGPLRWYKRLEEKPGQLYTGFQSRSDPTASDGVAGKKVGRERMVTSQVSGESLGRPLSVGSWLLAGKNSRARHSKVKEGLFREIHTP